MTYRALGVGLLLLPACLIGCKGGSEGKSTTSTTNSTTGSTTAGSTTAGTTTGATTAGTTGTTTGRVVTVPASCSSNSFIKSLGKDHFLIGFTGADATASAAPFDIRYVYLSAGIPDNGQPCASCATNCIADNKSCANAAGGCVWWGCYQYDQDKPGEYVRNLVSGAKAAGEIPMFTYYEILQTGYNKYGYSTFTEGAQEVTVAANDQALMTGYFNDFRFLLQQIGSDVAIIHHEPDFWGYAEQVNLDPTKITASVTSANATDCGSQPNTIAGFGACLVAMTRKYAPNAKIGLHASGWASNMDVLGNTQAGFDVDGEAAKTVAFLKAAGESNADLVISDISDRDAGYYQIIKNKQTWWDATNATLPDFHQGWQFGKDIATGLNKPLLWWQVPIGNVRLDNSNDCSDATPHDGKFQDNRVDYMFANLPELVASGAVGVAFGAGAACCTTAESDDGNLIASTAAYGISNKAASCQ